MPHWIIKSFLHRTISWLPHRHWWNRRLQSLTGSIELSDAAFERKLGECKHQLESLRQYAPEVPRDFSAVDLGTGWYPIMPIGYFLCGAKETHSYDISPLLERGRLAVLLGSFIAYADGGKLDQMLPEWQKERLETLRTLVPSAMQEEPAVLLGKLGIRIHVQDAQSTGLQSSSVDFLTSSGVLELIPLPVLQGIMKEFARVASPTALLFHRINLRDDYAVFDKGIPPLHFLRFSDRAWSWLGSGINPLNRLRIPTYRDLFQETGWKVVCEENIVGTQEDLRRVPLAKEFRNYSEADLLVLESWMMCRKQQP